MQHSEQPHKLCSALWVLRQAVGADCQVLLQAVEVACRQWELARAPGRAVGARRSIRRSTFCVLKVEAREKQAHQYDITGYPTVLLVVNGRQTRTIGLLRTY